MSETHRDSATVLVVDDNRSLVEMFTEVLEGHYQVRSALGGREALEQIDEEVDVMLLDRRMPDISGEEVLAELENRNIDCRVVIVTGSVPDFEIVELGFDGYIVKPVEPAEIISAVEQSLARGEYEDKVTRYYELSDRKSRLESAIGEDDLDNNPEYQEVCENLDEIRDDIDGILTEFDGSGYAATIERTQTVAVLRESRERYRSLTQDVLDSSETGMVIIGRDRGVEWANATVEEYFGTNRSEILQEQYPSVIRNRIAPLIERPDDFEQRLLGAIDANTDVLEFECRVVRNDCKERWLKHWSKPIESGLYAGGRIEHYVDISPLKERERSLERLHNDTRSMIDAGTADEVAQEAVNSARAVVGTPVSVVYLRDDDSGNLEPVSIHEEIGLEEPVTAIEPGQTSLWDAYIQGEIRKIQAETADHPCSGRGMGMVFPLGNHGLLYLGISDTDQNIVEVGQFARILASNTEVMLDRVEREHLLRDRDEKLEQQNEQLRRLNRINTTIRSIDQALMEASSRKEIEEAVCDRLAANDLISFVWMGEPDFVSDTLTVNAHAGEDDGYLDFLQDRLDSSDRESVPSLKIMNSREYRLENNLMDVQSKQPWITEALNHGFQSMLSVPIKYDDSLYGVLEIYGDRPAVFGADEQEIFNEMGGVIGHAINAIDRRDALISNDFVELEYHVTDTVDFLAGADRFGTDHLRIRTVVPQNDGSYLVFFSIDQNQFDLETFGDEHPELTELKSIRKQNGHQLLKCRVRESILITRIADLGAIPRSVKSNGDGTRVAILLPRSEDVREFTHRLSEHGIDAELVAHREHSREDVNSDQINERLDSLLTDRQREALELAYFSGYFDWPRDSNGQDLASTMDIDQSTLQQHLRTGQRHVFEAIFDSI